MPCGRLRLSCPLPFPTPPVAPRALPTRRSVPLRPGRRPVPPGREHFDVLVVGGGITGAGVALDAASRGLRTALVEKDDFASGTSSKSSKLVHGGLRYLQQREFRLVYENLAERQRLLDNAPHLVSPAPLPHPPVRAGRAWSTAGVAKSYRTALWLYDLTGGMRIGPAPPARRAGPRRWPTCRPCDTDRLVAGFLYWDARTDDARLTLGCCDRGARPRRRRANHARVVADSSTGERRVRATEAVGQTRRPAATAADFESAARVVVNAAGVWADQIRALDEGAATRRSHPPGQGHPPHRSRRAGCPCDIAAVLPVPEDHRSIFVVPWGEPTGLPGHHRHRLRRSRSTTRLHCPRTSPTSSAPSTPSPPQPLDPGRRHRRVGRPAAPLAPGRGRHALTSAPPTCPAAHRRHLGRRRGHRHGGQAHHLSQDGRRHRRCRRPPPGRSARAAVGAPRSSDSTGPTGTPARPRRRSAERLGDQAPPRTWPVGTAPRPAGVWPCRRPARAARAVGPGLPYLGVEAVYAVATRWRGRSTTCSTAPDAGRAARGRSRPPPPPSGGPLAWPPIWVERRPRRPRPRPTPRSEPLGRSRACRRGRQDSARSPPDRPAVSGVTGADAARRPVTPIDAAPSVHRRPPGRGHARRRRAEVDVAPTSPASMSATRSSDDDESRAEAGRDWWPLAVGWAARGQVPARPAVMRPTADTAQVAAVLAACNDAGVPVTPSAGRSGVCGGRSPSSAGVALDLTGLAGIVDVDDHVPLGRPARRHLRPRPGSRAARRPRRHPRPLAPVDGPLHRRRLAGLPRRRPVLRPLRQDRGHGHRPRGGTGRRRASSAPAARAPLGHRPRPEPALRGQRGHPRGHHRGPASGSTRYRGERAPAFGFAPSRTGSTPAGGSCGAGPPRRCSGSTTRPSRAASSTSRRPTCSSSSTRAIPAWSTPPWPWSTTSAGRRRQLDATLVDRWMEQRNDVSALAPLWRHGIVVDTVEVSGPLVGAARPLPTRCSTPSTAWTGRSPPPPTSPTPTPTAPACTSPSPDGLPPGSGDRPTDGLE